MFDSLNANSKVAPSTKPLKGGVREDLQHELFWRNAIKVLQSMRFFNSKKQSFVVVPSIKNLIHTIQGFLNLKRSLITDFKFKFILTRFFNQDPLENFFSYIRSHGARNISPGVTHFTSSFKTLIVNNFLSRHSPYSNCEEDVSNKLLSNLKSFILQDTSVEVTPLEVDSQSDMLSQIPDSVPLYKKSKVDRCTITYYAGYVAKKVTALMKKHQCKTCEKNLLLHAANDTEFIQAREYKPQLLLRPGGFLTFLVSQAVPHLYFLIPRLAHKKKIAQMLKQILYDKINFDPINCPQHNLKDTLCNFIIRCALYFWCRKINKIARGQDTKFIRFFKNRPDKILMDPMKIRAYKKWENKRKLRNVYKNKPSV